jgi:hypothetical protein
MMHPGAGVFPPGGTPASADRFRKEFSKLVLQSEKATPGCDKFGQGVATLRREEYDDGDDTFRTKAGAQKALKLVRSYPGVPKATHQAVGKALYGLPPNTDPSWFLAEFSRLQPCGVMAFHELARALVNSNLRHKFGAADRAGIRTALVAYLKKELAAPDSLTPTLAQISLFAQLHQAGLLKETPETRRAIESLVEQAHSARRDSQQMQTDATAISNHPPVPGGAGRPHVSLHEQARLRSLVHELQSAEGLRRSLLELVKRAKGA